jgi:hypothetical protein
MSCATEFLIVGRALRLPSDIILAGGAPALQQHSE